MNLLRIAYSKIEQQEEKNLNELSKDQDKNLKQQNTKKNFNFKNISRVIIAMLIFGVIYYINNNPQENNIEIMSINHNNKIRTIKSNCDLSGDRDDLKVCNTEVIRDNSDSLKIYQKGNTEMLEVFQILEKIEQQESEKDQFQVEVSKKKTNIIYNHLGKNIKYNCYHKNKMTNNNCKNTNEVGMHINCNNNKNSIVCQ